MAEWINKNEETECYECSNCGNRLWSRYHTCPFCKAEMQNGDAEFNLYLCKVVDGKLVPIGRVNED